MKDYLKLFLYTSFYFIKTNLVKLIMIVLSIVTFNYAGTFEDIKYERSVVENLVVEDFPVDCPSCELSNTYLYITMNIEDNKVKYDVIQRKEPESLKDGKIIWYEYSGYNIFLWVLFVLCLLILTIMTFSEDTDTRWKFRDPYRDAIKMMIHTEYKEGIYYYISFGRLLGKRDHQIIRDNILYDFSISRLSDIMFHPPFKK